jgi:hypothetical protein
VHVVKYPGEIDLFKARGIVVHRLADVVAALKRGDGFLEDAAAGNLVDLVAMTAGGRIIGDVVDSMDCPCYAPLPSARA